MKYQVCKVCENKLLLNSNFFHKKKDAKTGFRSACKECRKKEHKKRYSKNKEHILKVNKKWREENPSYMSDWYLENKETQKIKRKNYYKKNKLKITRYKNEWYLDNKPRIILMRKEYKKKNRHKVRLWENKRRTAKSNLDSDLTVEEWELIMLEFDNKCAYCGKDGKITQDHFIPLSKGGEFTINNIIPACLSCNCSKHTNDFFDWYPVFKHYSKQRENKILSHLNFYKNIQQLSIL